MVDPFGLLLERSSRAAGRLSPRSAPVWTRAVVRTERVVAQVDRERTDLAIPVTGPVRDVRFNEDHGALVKVERSRR